MTKYKGFSTTSYYGDDNLFAKAAVCTLIVGVATLLALLLGSVVSAHGRALSRPAVSGGVVGGAAVVPSQAADTSVKSRQTPPYQNTTKTLKSTKAAKATITVNRRHDVEIGLASRLLRESVDDSADPCRDLRAHVCSGYDSGELRGRPLEERAAQDVAVAVEASFRRAISPPSGLVAKHWSLRRAATYYRSCMDANPESPENVRALAAFFEHNDLQLSADAEGGAVSPDFLDKTVELLLRYDLGLFFDLRVDVFPNRGVRFVRVVANGDFVDWKRKRVAMTDRKEHGPLAQDALCSCGVGKHRAQELARRIWALEDKLLAKVLVCV
ncbi:uncharacterized protein [Dermacentor andersoni]|uniref:uncharacterized protein n=1 Tax=Dermacentor andersoni TaxID=34620 RepID=UPI002416A9F9|nr:uncharacterized protein LOC129383881 [Dermacentor andersoni]